MKVPDLTGERWPTASTVADAATINLIESGAQVLFDEPVVAIRQRATDDTEVLQLGDGRSVVARNVIVATGIGRPKIPVLNSVGDELIRNYLNETDAMLAKLQAGDRSGQGPLIPAITTAEQFLALSRGSEIFTKQAPPTSETRCDRPVGYTVRRGRAPRIAAVRPDRLNFLLEDLTFLAESALSFLGLEQLADPFGLGKSHKTAGVDATRIEAFQSSEDPPRPLPALKVPSSPPPLELRRVRAGEPEHTVRLAAPRCERLPDRAEVVINALLFEGLDGTKVPPLGTGKGENISFCFSTGDKEGLMLSSSDLERSSLEVLGNRISSIRGLPGLLREFVGRTSTNKLRYEFRLSRPKYVINLMSMTRSY